MALGKQIRGLSLKQTSSTVTPGSRGAWVFRDTRVPVAAAFSLFRNLRNTQDRSRRTHMFTRLWIHTIALLLSVLFTCVSVAQDKVKVWENAVNYMQDDKGCFSIPYSDRQESCVRKQNEVNKWCKDSGPFNCDKVDPKKLQADIEKLKTQWDELKVEKEKLERANDNEKRDLDNKIKDIDTKIDSAKKTREDLEKQVQENTKQVNDRLGIAKGCRDARSAVQEVFKDVRSTADRENDPQIVPLTKRLIPWWDGRYQSHEIAVNDAKIAIDTCEKVLYEIGRLGSF